MPRSVTVPVALLAVSLLTANAGLDPAPLAAQQEGGMMEKDSSRMGKQDKMDTMGKDKMMGDGAMGMGANTMFMGATGQKAAGDYQVSEVDGKQALKLTERFSVAPAPDLHLVLSTGPAPVEGSLFLARLKQTEGAQSYDLPRGKDLSRYTTLLVWSKKEKRAVATAEWHPASGGMMMKDDKMMKDGDKMMKDGEKMQEKP